MGNRISLISFQTHPVNCTIFFGGGYCPSSILLLQHTWIPSCLLEEGLAGCTTARFYSKGDDHVIDVKALKGKIT